MIQGGAGNKAVTYSEFQDYVKNGYVSKVLGYEDKSIEAYLKPNSVGAVFGADSTKVGRNPIITSRAPSTDKLEEFLQAEKEAGHFDGTSDYPPKSDIFPAILIQVLPLVLLIALWIFFMRRMSGGGSGGPGGVFNVGKSKAQLFEKRRGDQDYIQRCSRPGGSQTGSRRNCGVLERTSKIYRLGR